MDRRNSLKLGVGALTGLMLASNTQASSTLELDVTNSFWDVLKNRRSVRAFKPDVIPEQHLIKIIDAARMAPTAGNQQPWKFLLVQNPVQIEKLKEEMIAEAKNYLSTSKKLEGEELIKKLEETDKRISEGYLSAPAFIVVLTDQNCKYPSYTNHDGALAAGYLMLAARAFGYGTVYITDAISEDATRKAFNIPQELKRVCITPIGVPKEWPTKEKKELDAFIVKENF